MNSYIIYDFREEAEEGFAGVMGWGEERRYESKPNLRLVPYVAATIN